MKQIQALVVNLDMKANELNTAKTFDQLHNNEISTVYTDFWNIPPYIMKAITNKELHIIVLYSIAHVPINELKEIMNKLSTINNNNVPVIIVEQAILQQDTVNLLQKTGVEKIITNHLNIKDSIIKTVQKTINISQTNLLNIPEKIAHIGIAVHNIEKALSFYTKALNLNIKKIEVVQSEGVKVAFIQIGESYIELLEPLSEQSPIQHFLNKRGSGIHHIALKVGNIQQKLNHLKSTNIQLINEQAKSGANESKIAFIHPKSAYGVLFEICEYRGEET